MLCLDQPSLSSKWPWTKSNSLLLPRVRFDIHALSLNIQISRSCSNRLCLNLPREFRYCNGSEFEFPSWINKPLFGSKAIVSRYPFMDIWDTKQRVLSLNLISFSWYVYLNRFQSKESLLGLIMKEHKIARNFCAKVLLRIISTKLFVLWQVLKPPTRKAISKRILSQRFYFFNLTLWLNYKKTGRQMYNEKTQNWNIARSFCAKVLLRIISIKLFVLWQVLKPPIRKAIFKRILRQRF